VHQIRQPGDLRRIYVAIRDRNWGMITELFQYHMDISLILPNLVCRRNRRRD
jgi:hypothetical protein